ncbi:MAG TPA: zf-HC2 domain-containing protein [Vicinamibacteria bacterium]|jgi:anti-sigma factor RsiW
MSCDPERVTAYVDGALDAAGGPELEAHLAACPECRAQADEERALRAQLRALPPPSPSPGLEARVRASLRPRRRAASWLLPLAAGVVILLAWARGAAPFVAWEISRDHDHCFGARRLPAKLWSSDPARVAEWFEGQGTRVPMIPAAAGGLELVGARYCPLFDRRVAHLYYSDGDHHLSLFLVPGPVREVSREMRPRGNVVRFLRVGGTTVGLVSEEAQSVEAFRRALSTTVAWDMAIDRPAP